MRRLLALGAGLSCVLAASAIAPRAARAQDGVEAVSAFSHSRAETGDVVSYTVTVKGSDLPRVVREPRPTFSAFQVVGGPAFGRSLQVSMIGGRTTQQTVLTFTWRLLPRETGELVVPATSLRLGGSDIAVPEASLTVVERGASRTPQPSARSGAGSRQGAPTRRDDRARAGDSRRWEQDEPDDLLRVRAIVDDPRPWVGEEIVLTHVLEYRGNVHAYTPAGTLEMTGFSKTRRDVQAKAERVEDEESGEEYQRAPVDRWSLVPLATGAKTVPSRPYRIDLRQRTRDPFGFGVFAGRLAREVEATQPLTLDVRPLPSGAPDSFAGAVGRYELEATLTESELDVGDGTTLRVTISGTGSFRDVTAPDVPEPEGVKVFDPEVLDRTRATASGHTAGEKVFDFPLLVSEEGTVEVGPIEWTFFDPRAARYVTRRTGTLTLNVQPAPPGAFVPPSEPARATLEVRETDIHHLRAQLDLDEVARENPVPLAWLSLAAVGPLLLLGAAGWRAARRAAAKRDPSVLRAQRAEPRARRRLAEAGAAARAGEAVRAADASARAIAGLVADRLDLGEGEPSAGEISGAVAAAGHSEQAVRVRSFLDDCDQVRFAGGAGAGATNPRALVERGRKLVDELASLSPSSRGRAA